MATRVSRARWVGMADIASQVLRPPCRPAPYKSSVEMLSKAPRDLSSTKCLPTSRCTTKPPYPSIQRRATRGTLATGICLPPEGRSCAEKAAKGHRDSVWQHKLCRPPATHMASRRSRRLQSVPRFLSISKPARFSSDKTPIQSRSKSSCPSSDPKIKSRRQATQATRKARPKKAVSRTKSDLALASPHLLQQAVRMFKAARQPLDGTAGLPSPLPTAVSFSPTSSLSLAAHDRCISYWALVAAEVAFALYCMVVALLIYASSSWCFCCGVGVLASFICCS